MQPLLVRLVLAACIVAAHQAANALPFTSASISNPGIPGTSEACGTEVITVKQVLPVGDKMLVKFTEENGDVIKNDDDSVPFVSQTVQPQTQGIQFTVHPVLNGKCITDIEQKHSSDSVPDGTIEIAVFKNAGSFVEPLGVFLDTNSFTAGNELSVPDFVSPAINIFYGVDLNVWVPSGFPITNLLLGTNYSIVNGVNALLPGFLFSETLLTHTANTPWATSSPYTGNATLDSFHLLAVPEPTTAALVGLGLLGVLASARRLWAP